VSARRGVLLAAEGTIPAGVRQTDVASRPRVDETNLLKKVRDVLEGH
jgi:hypothetical protein